MGQSKPEAAEQRQLQSSRAHELLPRPCHCCCSARMWGFQDLPSLPPYFHLIPASAFVTHYQAPLSCMLHPAASTLVLSGESSYALRMKRRFLNTAGMALTLPTLSLFSCPATIWLPMPRPCPSSAQSLQDLSHTHPLPGQLPGILQISGG